MAGFGWAAATVATKEFQRTRRLDTVNFVAWQLLFGLTPFIPIVALHPAPPVAVTPFYLALVGYAGIVSIAIAWLLWVGILSRLSASAAGFSMLAIPVLALAISVFFFGEVVAGSEWLGMALIAAGLALLGILARRARRAVASIDTESPP